MMARVSFVLSAGLIQSTIRKNQCKPFHCNLSHGVVRRMKILCFLVSAGHILRRNLASALPAFVLGALIVSCGALCPFSFANDEPISVVTTLFPLQSFAQAVGGERAEVELLLPPGAEPHAWEPRPSDIVRLAHADLFIFVSEQMEPWVPDVIRAADNKIMRLVEAGSGMAAKQTVRPAGPYDTEHDEPHGSAYEDPHVWLDFSYDQYIVDSIAAALIALDPDHAEFYRRNTATYKKKLLDLDQRYREGLAQCTHTEIILGGHAAFGYLVERYGLKQIPLYGFSPNAEPTPRRMAEVITIAKKHQAEAVFFEEFVSDRLAKAIAEELGAKTLVLNPGANVTEEQRKQKMTFLSIMEQNLESLRDGLACK